MSKRAAKTAPPMAPVTDEQRRSVYLVQRVEARDLRPDAKGVDASFAFDYMGSAEFEFGALPHSLALMRAAPRVLLPLHAGEHVAWFVGREEEAPVAEALFADQLGPKKWPYLKERTDIPRAYGLVTDWPSRAIGWWAIQQKWGSPRPWVPFAFFKDEAAARLWLAALA